MKKIYSKIDPNILLHQIIKLESITPGRLNISNPKEFLQLATIHGEKGKIFPSHKHLWKNGEKDVITQECWIVIRGQLNCTFYDTNGSLLGEEILNEGDCAITFQGGHGVRIAKEDTIFYEVKNGPYKGQGSDYEVL